MRGELKLVLAEDDLRWKEFNLPVPAESKTATQKTVREQKKQAKDVAHHEQRLHSGMDQLLKARLRGEKLRARYDRMLAGLEGLKAEMDKSAAEISEAEAKVKALGGTVTLALPQPSERSSSGARRVTPDTQADAEAASVLVA